METTPRQEDEATITAETVDAWSTELREFADAVRQRLLHAGDGGAVSAVAGVDDVDGSNTTAPPSAGSSSFGESGQLSKSVPHERLMASRETPNRDEAFGVASGASDDALQRLHEIKQRLAARLQGD